MAHNDQIPLSPYILPPKGTVCQADLLCQGELDSLPFARSSRHQRARILAAHRQVYKRRGRRPRTPPHTTSRSMLSSSSLLSEIMSSPHTLLHRPNLCTPAPFHALLSHLPPVYHHVHSRLKQRSLRHLLPEQVLCPRRRHLCHRTQHARTRIPPHDRLEINGQRTFPFARNPFPSISIYRCPPYPKVFLHSNAS